MTCPGINLLSVNAAAAVYQLGPFGTAEKTLPGIKLVKWDDFAKRMVFPDGKLPTSTAGGTPVTTFSDRL